MTRPRRWAMSGAVSALVAVALGGCSLLVDTSGLGDGTTAAVTGTSGDAASNADADASVVSSADGPSGDAAVEGGAAPCPSFAFFCDDFESGNTGKWSASYTMANGTVTVAGPSAGMPSPWAGAFAVHVYAGKNATTDSGATPESLAQLRLTIPPVFSGSVFFRFYLYLPSTLTTNSSLAKLGHQDTTAGPDDINLKVSAVNGFDRLRINTDNAIANDSNHDSVMPFPLGKWSCVEVGLTLAAAGHLSVWTDGVQVIDVPENTVGTSTVPFDQIRLGFSSTPGTVTQEFYADDYAYATQRIGCE